MADAFSRATNRSYDTDGMEDPTRQWLQRRVRVRNHPEWGIGRVMRWYPAHSGQPARLRVMMEGRRSPQIVQVADVDVLT